MVVKKPWMSDIVLVVDTMALHKATIWDPKTKQYVGTVDYGTAVPEPADSLAMEALVFVIVALTGHWKHPIGYVPQDKCSTHVPVYLIKGCIELHHTEGLNVHAMVLMEHSQIKIQLKC